jgi:hypothetical protein
MGSGHGATPSTSISIFPFTGGQDKSRAETWPRRAWLAEEGPPPAPSLPPPSPSLRAAPLAGSARLGWRRLGRRAQGVGSRVSLERWPSGAPGSRAEPSAARQWEGASQQLAQPHGRPGLALQPRPWCLTRSCVSGDPPRFSFPSNLRNKVVGGTDQRARTCLA